jgi:hypothetical protein
LAAGFVGVDAVIAHRLLALGRDVEKSGGDEVGGFEYLEVALGGVVVFGAVDDGLGGGVPGDFLEGGVFAKATPAQGRDGGGDTRQGVCGRRRRGRERFFRRGGG